MDNLSKMSPSITANEESTEGRKGSDRVVDSQFREGTQKEIKWGKTL